MITTTLPLVRPPEVVGGRRVAVVACKLDDTLYFVGYGVITGQMIPPSGLGMMADALRDQRERTPKIVLDNGDVVYGFECWYGDADEFDATNEEPLETMTVAELREAARITEQEALV